MKRADDDSGLSKQHPGDGCCGAVRAVGVDWHAPSKEGKLVTGLVVNNSMAGKKVEFIPQKGNRVCWYACGPTVYDASHMGHARTYVTFDVIRRIMSDYFNYDVFLCMNITDIDDKIIKRSMEQGVDFLKLARHWEADFFNDMAALNVRLPTVITRVSEHIPEVLAMVEQIMENGYAYESEGSIYFDTQSFNNSDKHMYGRMEPSSVADESRALEGEGDLGVISSEKRHPCDFALWKKAKEGEPSWDSPWGKGRPDLHSGGIDLRFPHHDNEVAQSEAAKDAPHWVNYFLHSGHLHIRGAKMSKSLKNFVTIKECLARFSPRHLRLLCLMNRWDSLMNYSPDGETMQQAVDVDRSFVDFFALVRAKLRDATPVASYPQKWNAPETALSEELQNAKDHVHKCLLDNFNTPGALVALQRLMSATNTYLNEHRGGDVRAPLIRAVAQYVFRMLRVFGVVKDEDEDLRYSAATTATREDAISGESELEEQVLECIGSFREQMLKALQPGQHNRWEETLATSAGTANNENGVAGGACAVEKGETLQENGVMPCGIVKRGVTDLLRACDELRDKKLRALGIFLQDRPDGTFVIKRVSKEEVDRETELKEEEEKKRLVQKEERQRMAAEMRERKILERQTPPRDYYKVLHSDLYATYDADGVPLTLKSGEEVSKSQRQKMQKFLQKHEKVYKEAQGSEPAVKRT